MAREKPTGVQLRRQAIDVTELQWLHLNDEWRPREPVPEGLSKLEPYLWGGPSFKGLTTEEAWERCRETILARWIAEAPGTRPPMWWRFDAPRWADPWEGCFYHGTFAEPRLRLGGRGTPAHEALNVVPTFDRGIPAAWVERWAVDLYNGRPLCWDGKPFTRRDGRSRVEGDFPHDAIDPADPPTFESEAAYLKRHGLLFDGEEGRIPAEGWEPEVVELVED